MGHNQGIAAVIKDPHTPEKLEVAFDLFNIEETAQNAFNKERLKL